MNFFPGLEKLLELERSEKKVIKVFNLLMWWLVNFLSLKISQQKLLPINWCNGLYDLVVVSII
ncbi:MAG: hypothetical protein ABIL04_03480 [candidate division WOR-3 bacterium]